MSNFNFCGFYGVSAPLAIIMQESELDRIIQKVKGFHGYTLLRNLESELRFLESVLESDTFSKTYDYEQLYKEGYAQIFRKDNLRDFRIVLIKCQRHFDSNTTDFEGLTYHNWLKIKSALDESGIILNKTVNIDGVTETLDDLTYQIISIVFKEAYKNDKLKNTIKKVRDARESCNSETLKLFGQRVADMAKWEDSWHFNEWVFKQYRNELSNRSGKILADSCNKIISKIDLVEEYLKEVKEHKEKQPLPAKENEDPETYKSFMANRNNDFDLSLWRTIYRLGTFKYVKEDLNLYDNIHSLMKLVESYNKVYWELKLDRRGTEDLAFEESFHKCDELGIVGLNLYLKDFFLDSLRNNPMELGKEEVPASSDLMKDNLAYMKADAKSKKKKAEVNEKSWILV